MKETPEALKKKLERLASEPSLDEIALSDSKWGISADGFESVLAERAKLSGLFTLPGYPRPRDYTKLFPSVREKLPYFSEDPDGESQIEAYQALAARTLIVRRNYEVDNNLVADHFGRFLRGIDIEVAGVASVTSSESVDDYLIIEFKNNECATIALSLNQETITVTSDGSPAQITLSIERPKEYVAPNITSESSDEIVPDSPKKITLRTTADSDLSIASLVEPVGKFSRLQMLREIGTRKFMGIAFIEFTDSSPDIIDKLNKIEGVQSAEFSCQAVARQYYTAEFENLKKMAKADGATTRTELTCIVLGNLFLPRDLYDEDNYRFVVDDVRQEAERFGKVSSMKIPRPISGDERGLGKAYLEFETIKEASDAINALAGRFYNDRTVLCSFFSADDYHKNLF